MSSTACSRRWWRWRTGNRPPTRRAGRPPPRRHARALLSRLLPLACEQGGLPTYAPAPSSPRAGAGAQAGAKPARCLPGQRGVVRAGAGWHRAVEARAAEHACPAAAPSRAGACAADACFPSMPRSVSKPSAAQCEILHQIRRKAGQGGGRVRGVRWRARPAALPTIHRLPVDQPCTRPKGGHGSGAIKGKEGTLCKAAVSRHVLNFHRSSSRARRWPNTGACSLQTTLGAMWLRGLSQQGLSTLQQHAEASGAADRSQQAGASSSGTANTAAFGVQLLPSGFGTEAPRWCLDRPRGAATPPVALQSASAGGGAGADLAAAPAAASQLPEKIAAARQKNREAQRRFRCGAGNGESVGGRRCSCHISRVLTQRIPLHERAGSGSARGARSRRPRPTAWPRRWRRCAWRTSGCSLRRG